MYDNLVLWLSPSFCFAMLYICYPVMVVWCHIAGFFHAAKFSRFLGENTTVHFVLALMYMMQTTSTLTFQLMRLIFVLKLGER